MKGESRWKVAILDDHERSRAALRAAIWAAGGEVVGEAYRAADALTFVQRTRPDVAIFESGNRSMILPASLVSSPSGPYGGQNPPPNSGASS